MEWGDVLLRAVSGRTDATTVGGSVTKVVTIENLPSDQLTITR